MRQQNNTKFLLTPLRIALLYIILGCLWIIFSDRLVYSFGLTLSSLTFFQMIKGVFFMIVTGSLLYGLVRYFAYERAKTEDIIRKSHFHLTSILDGINDGFIALDNEMKFTLVNKRAAILLNHSPEECAGKSLREIIPDTENQVLREELERTSRKREPAEFEYFYAVTHEWFMIRIYPTDEGFSIFFQNITQQKETEVERQLQLAIIDKTNDIIGLATPDGNLTYLNRAGIEFLGFDPSKQDKKRNILEAHPKWAYDIVSKNGIPEAAERGLWKGETVLLDAKGKEVPVSQLIMSHKTTDGKPAYYSCIIRDITEIKLKEESLRQSEEKFSRAFHASPNAIVITRSSDNVIIDVNESFVRTSGFSYGEVIGKTTVDLDMWKDYSDRNHFLSLFMRDGRVTNHLFQFKMKSGEIRYGSISGEIIHIGSEKCYLNVIEDVTIRKKTEDLIRQANDRLKFLLTATSVVIYTATTEKPDSTTFMSDNVIRITGFSADEFKNSETLWHQNIHPEDREKAKRNIDSLITKDSQTFEFRFCRKDGRYIWIREECKLIHTNDGEPKEIIGYFTDITQIKEIGETLKINEERLRLALEATSDGLWDWDLTTNKNYYSPRWYTMLGYKPNAFEANFENWAKLSVPEDVEHTIARLNDSLENGTPYESEFRMKAADGSMRWILGRGSVTKRNSQGKAIRLSGTNTDITERRKVEEALRESRDQLRNFSARLQSIREEERTYLAREIHDELGQILTGLKMDLSLLDAILQQEARLTLRRDVRAKIDSMAGLLDSAIRSMRKIMTELRPVVLDTMGLSAAIEWQAEEFQQRTGIACFYSPPLDVPALPRDLATSVFRILQESLTNITRHAGASRTTITMKIDQGNLILLVHDNGRGISEENIDQQKSFGITGMRERVELLGGKFSIHGIKGKGTLLSVEIPLPANPG